MENIKIEGTENSPEIDFNFESNIFEIGGKCYMENANAFFMSFMETFTSHLNSLNGVEVVFKFQLTYFNSSSARFIMRIFDHLDSVAERGNKVIINWHFEEDDDNMEEQGDEFGEDLKYANFELKPVTG